MINAAYLFKIQSTQELELHNFSVKHKNIVYTLIWDKKNQRGYLEWELKKVPIIKVGNDLITFCDSSKILIPLEYIFKKMNKEIQLSIYNLNFDKKVNSISSTNLIDFDIEPDSGFLGIYDIDGEEYRIRIDKNNKIIFTTTVEEKLGIVVKEILILKDILR